MTEPWEKYEAEFSEHEKQIAREMNASEQRMWDELHSPRRFDKYILNEQNVAVPVPLGTWSVWFERENRKPNRGRLRVGLDEWDDPAFGHVRVSTVFLGLDHSFWYKDESRKIFETMIFWGWSKETAYSEQNMWRYPTYDSAKTGHAHALQLTKRFLAGEITREQYGSDEEE